MRSHPLVWETPRPTAVHSLGSTRNGRPFRGVEQCVPLDPCGLHTYFFYFLFFIFLLVRLDFIIVKGPRRNNGQCDAGIARDAIIVVFRTPVHDASCARGRDMSGRRLGASTSLRFNAHRHSRPGTAPQGQGRLAPRSPRRALKCNVFRQISAYLVRRSTGKTPSCRYQIAESKTKTRKCSANTQI
jgi:hypothetical protein